jgi:hypothetical protein
VDVASSILHLARWLAWQVGSPGFVGPEQPASITVFSGAAK